MGAPKKGAGERLKKELARLVGRGRTTDLREQISKLSGEFGTVRKSGRAACSAEAKAHRDKARATFGGVVATAREVRNEAIAAAREICPTQLAAIAQRYAPKIAGLRGEAAALRPAKRTRDASKLTAREARAQEEDEATRDIEVHHPELLALWSKVRKTLHRGSLRSLYEAFLEHVKDNAGDAEAAQSADAARWLAKELRQKDKRDRSDHASRGDAYEGPPQSGPVSFGFGPGSHTAPRSGPGLTSGPWSQQRDGSTTLRSARGGR